MGLGLENAAFGVGKQWGKWALREALVQNSAKSAARSGELVGDFGWGSMNYN
jgi:hypothetical protein